MPTSSVVVIGVISMHGTQLQATNNLEHSFEFKCISEPLTEDTDELCALYPTVFEVDFK